MINNFCLSCNESVYNPVCPFCLAEEIKLWLNEKGNFGKINKEINLFLEETKKLAGESTQCITCKRATAFLCPYCFTEHVLNLLKKHKSSRKILREFFEFFNFDFEHTGYYLEMENL
ncbi:hypothetical protein COV15_01030 [Candidatus Woesearchaeota archaeon CG10_big_fil_rev_8_21_14_0_10_34_12]|nr:MAG: hypothetical protein COV15_01030 [Candidatus Woesearchaeota archaeon CG10_big_fil_rev_8_21_14_0_10_34_12]